jgi:hypothetical protein
MRRVEIPDDAPTAEEVRLEAVFYHGQNDHQPHLSARSCRGTSSDGLRLEARSP